MKHKALFSMYIHTFCLIYNKTCRSTHAKKTNSKKINKTISKKIKKTNSKILWKALLRDWKISYKKIKANK